MTDDREGIELIVAGSPAAPAPGVQLTWVDRDRGLGSVRQPPHPHPALVVVEGGPAEWVVTLGGRRVVVTARSRRDRLIAEAQQQAGGRRGPVEVRATLPGLVLHVLVEVGQLVEAGDPLVTIEAMKMQNEIRAPRAGKVASIATVPGQTLAAGAPLVRLVDPEP
jgi:biotin carboxyl carrier protein